MLRLTLAQMRRSAGRLTAAGIAIVIGAAFVAATLLSGEVLTRTAYDAAASQYGDADLVITEASLDASRLDAIAAQPGVAAVQSLDGLGVRLSAGSRQVWATTMPRAADPRLEPATVAEGALPADPTEIALPTPTAGQLEVGLGDTVTASLEYWPQGGDEPSTDVRDLTVVGLLDTPSAFLAGGVPAVVDPTVQDTWTTETFGDAPVEAWEATVAVAPGSSVAQVRDEVAAVLAGQGRVLTRDARAAEMAAELSGSTWVLTGVVLGFAAVALLVASLVIANTFQVLVAQRTRTLALLRCVGAEKGQLRRGVLTEATLLGLGASATGVLLGIALVQALLAVLGRTTDVPLPATVTVGPAVLLVPIGVGTLVTLLASLAPARAATRVSPLAALRPGGTGPGERAGRARAWLAGSLVVVGAAGLALGMVVATALSMPFGLLVGMLGGAMSFVGVMVGAAFWVPALLARLGRVLGRTAAVRLASANAVRNPRRVAATSGALFIGVTLVVMMSTGAASVTRTFAEELQGRYPVDVAVETVPGASTSDGDLGVPDAGQDALPAGLVTDLLAVDGVSDHAVLQRSTVTLEAPGTVGGSRALYGGDPATLRTVLADPEQAAALRDGTIELTSADAANLGVGVGDRVTATGADGSVELEVASTDTASSLVTSTTLTRLDASAPAAALWLHLDPRADALDVVTELQDLVAAQDAALVQVAGLAVERQFYQRVIDTLLAVVVGLLGVAVVIAMVGVANTLSLSVLERRRESATLRAIGMTRGQLRASLAAEGALVALVGTVVGALLGMAYGWIGAHILLAEVTSVALAVPWRDLGLVLLVAVAAGLLASVLPSRSATRTPPVEALAAE